MRETIKNISLGYGAEQIESKNPYMDSYQHEKGRINYYFSTGTLTLQEPDNTFRKCMVLKEEDAEDFYEQL